MEMLRQFERLFTYDDWANREAVASLRAARTPPPRPLRIMAHIVAAEWLWLGRLRGDPQWVAVWPELSLSECEAQLALLPDAWRSYLDRLGVEDFERDVRYTNSQGEGWTNRVQEILMHVVVHSAYHRGQVASELRAAGHAPAMTDLIHAFRQGLVE